MAHECHSHITQARLGIEPNPGPPSTPTTNNSATAQSLYTDVLHSIFAFLEVDQVKKDPHANYSRMIWCRDFIDAAMVSQSWLAAASTMKFPSSSFDDDLEICWYTRPWMTRPQLRLLCQSRIRKSVHRVTFSDWEHKFATPLRQFIRLCREIDFADQLSHIQRLELTVYVEDGVLNYLDDDTFRLPLSLRHLRLMFNVVNYGESENESIGYGDTSRSKRVAEAMIMFVQCVRRSSCQQLEILELNAPVSHGRSPTLDRCALEPWATLASLRHLILEKPTFQCIDLARTMIQLRRIDGLVQDHQIHRFLFGDPSIMNDTTSAVNHNDASSPLPRVNGSPLSIDTFCLQDKYHNSNLIFMSIPTLTDIRITSSRSSSSSSRQLIERICCKVKNLHRICISNVPSSSLEGILDTFVTFASQLEFIEIQTLCIKEDQLINFLPLMNRLECITLERCSYVRNVVDPNKFLYPLTVKGENTWKRTIRTIKIDHYSKWKQQKQHTATAVVIESPVAPFAMPRLVGSN